MLNEDGDKPYTQRSSPSPVCSGALEDVVHTEAHPSCFYPKLLAVFDSHCLCKLSGCEQAGEWWVDGSNKEVLH